MDLAKLKKNKKRTYGSRINYGANKLGYKPKYWGISIKYNNDKSYINLC